MCLDIECVWTCCLLDLLAFSPPSLEVAETFISLFELSVLISKSSQSQRVAFRMVSSAIASSLPLRFSGYCDN